MNDPHQLLKQRQVLERLQRDITAYCDNAGIVAPELFIGVEGYIHFWGIPGHEHDLLLPETFLLDEADIQLPILTHLMQRDDVMSKLYRIDRRRHAKLSEAYERQCMDTGLGPPPMLLGSRSVYATGMAFYNEDTIIIGDALVHGPVEEALGVIGHEMGHLLAPQDPLTAEESVDTFSAQWLGHPGPLIQSLSKYGENVPPPHVLAAMNRYLRNPRNHYDPSPVRQQKLAQVDPEDRELVQQLIKKRRERMGPGQSKPSPFIERLLSQSQAEQEQKGPRH